MNKTQILILSLVILMFTLTSVSASNNTETSTQTTLNMEKNIPLAQETNDNQASINKEKRIQFNYQE